ncbi:uncharacterized protein CC84DRAFT_363594 [Paraphaeosphaeria sporulosa]|uniref:Uncharacterized protein n=1 Tax=Paraphaeosphaeria sporulosa TaxID=1460663 RepID=A0A177BXH3_9PLEO|nr:uncharacterized protein CC84DRAFT_363594 [Paraphaeosphaeria sporulosa]OAG00214.1 hypothetical protein CC84DRAFT_363594 [Paraphaeosphaeria sporulosa]
MFYNSTLAWLLASKDLLCEALEQCSLHASLIYNRRSHDMNPRSQRLALDKAKSRRLEIRCFGCHQGRTRTAKQPCKASLKRARKGAPVSRAWGAREWSHTLIFNASKPLSTLDACLTALRAWRSRRGPWRCHRRRSRGELSSYSCVLVEK